MIRFQIKLLFLFWIAGSVADRAKSNDLYFPPIGKDSERAWETVAPDKVGWDATKLSQALDFAMDRKSSSVVILHAGRIMAERHQSVEQPSTRYQGLIRGETDAGHVIEDVASCQKSVVSFLVGLAVGEGLIELDAPVRTYLGEGWSKATPDQEQEITVRHLLTMTSGLKANLEYNTAPGTQWKYNTGAYARSFQCVTTAAKLSPNELTSRSLTSKIGMQDSRWADRPWANLASGQANKIGFATSGRDLARFGLLVLSKGRWNDQVVMTDEDYLKQALTSSQELNPAYGFLWWLNEPYRRNPGSRAQLLVKSAPRDLVAAQGALGRKCYVVPSLQLVVTRLGDDPDADWKDGPKFAQEFWRLLMLAKQSNSR